MKPIQKAVDNETVFESARLSTKPFLKSFWNFSVANEPVFKTVRFLLNRLWIPYCYRPVLNDIFFHR